MATEPPYLPPPSDLPKLNADITDAEAALERSERQVTRVEARYVQAWLVRDRARAVLRSLRTIWERMRAARRPEDATHLGP